MLRVRKSKATDMMATVETSSSPELNTARNPEVSMPSNATSKNVCAGVAFIRLLYVSNSRSDHLRQFGANRQRRSRPWARSIHYMQLARALDEIEIVHQRPVRSHRLRPHPGAPGHQVFFANLRHQLLQGLAEQLLAEAASGFIPANLP